MTVSNVVNGKESVSEALRVSVLAAVKELGYQPNKNAQALASVGSKTIGLMYRNYENAFLSSLLLGALRGAAEINCQLMVQEHHDFHGGDLLEGVERLLRRGVDGILLPAPAVESLDHPASRHLGVPVVAICPGDPLRYHSAVRIDDRAAMMDMTRAVIGRGHRRIAFIRAPREFLIGSSRLEGFMMAMAEASIPVDERLIVSSDLSYEAGLAAAQDLLDRPDRPTAIVSSNDDMAAAVISVALRRGLDVPSQLSVTGFNDGPIAHKIWPPLATVRQPVSTAAFRAVELLAQMMADGGRASKVITEYVDYEVVERRSLADAPGSMARADSSEGFVQEPLGTVRMGRLF